MQKTKLEDFTAEDKYGYELFSGADSKRFEPRQVYDHFWDPALDQWIVLSEDPKKFSSPFHPQYFYRRQLPLGNAPGAAPEWRLVQWQEQFQDGDQFTRNGVNWEAVYCILKPATPKGWLDRGTGIIAVRRRVAAAAEAAPAAPAQATTDLGWPYGAQRAADNASFTCCPKCGGPRHCRVCEPTEPTASQRFYACCRREFQKRGWDTTLLPLDFTVAQLCDWITALAPELKVRGEWVDKPIPSDGRRFDVQTNTGYVGIVDGMPSNGEIVKWLRLFPKPAPPPLPAPEPCCAAWRDWEDTKPTVPAICGPVKMCPWCGKPRPSYQEAAA